MLEGIAGMQIFEGKRLCDMEGNKMIDAMVDTMAYTMIDVMIAVGILVGFALLVYLIILIGKNRKGYLSLREVERRWRKEREVEGERHRLERMMGNKHLRGLAGYVEDFKRQKELRGKFKHFMVQRYRAAYRYDYISDESGSYKDGMALPNIKIVKAEDFDTTAKQAIWSFKEGNYQIGVDVLSEYIEGHYGWREMKNLALCVIPASTGYRNYERYQMMCEIVARRFPIINGFSFITPVLDRMNSRDEKRSDTIECLAFSPLVFGKDILLFDDVVTRGVSFRQAADVLMLLGAKSVTGVFLGQTNRKGWRKIIMNV